MNTRRSRLFLFACVIGLTLTIFAWVRSHIRLETISWVPVARGYSIFSDRGDVAFMSVIHFYNGYHDGEYWSYLNFPAGRTPEGGRYRSITERADRGWIIRWGDTSRTNKAWPGWIIVVPYWLIALSFATPLLMAGWRRLKSRRDRDAGLCPTCGYDLRATPDRCPECGATNPKASVPA
jgi:hypothetical protein